MNTILHKVTRNGLEVIKEFENPDQAMGYADMEDGLLAVPTEELPNWDYKDYATISIHSLSRDNWHITWKGEPK